MKYKSYIRKRMIELQWDLCNQVLKCLVSQDMVFAYSNQVWLMVLLMVQKSCWPVEVGSWNPMIYSYRVSKTSQVGFRRISEPSTLFLTCLHHLECIQPVNNGKKYCQQYVMFEFLPCCKRLKCCFDASFPVRTWTFRVQWWKTLGSFTDYMAPFFEPLTL